MKASGATGDEFGMAYGADLALAHGGVGTGSFDNVSVGSSGVGVGAGTGWCWR